MTWQTTVETHDVWNQLDALERACQVGDWPDNADVRDLVDRAQWLSGEVRARADWDSHSVTASSLQAVRDGLYQTAAALPNVRSNPAGYLAQAHQYIDSTIQAMAPWPPAKVQKAVRAATEAARVHREELERLLEASREEVSRLEQVVSDQQAAAQSGNDELKREVDKAVKSLTDLGSRIDKQINEHAETFSAGEAARKEKAAVTLAEVQEAAKDQREADHDAADKVLGELRQMRAEARNLLESMGVEATTSYYSKYAEEQRRAANWWSALTIVVGLGAAAAVLWTLHEFSVTADPAWSLISLKSLAGLTLLGVAGYVGKEAHGHREQERRAKHRALALQALEPFLANVQSSETDTLRLALAAELFAEPQSQAAASVEDSLSIAGFLRDLVRDRTGEGAEGAK